MRQKWKIARIQEGAERRSRRKSTFFSAKRETIISLIFPSSDSFLVFLLCLQLFFASVLSFHHSHLPSWLTDFSSFVSSSSFLFLSPCTRLCLLRLLRIEWKNSWIYCSVTVVLAHNVQSISVVCLFLFSALIQSFVVSFFHLKICLDVAFWFFAVQISCAIVQSPFAFNLALSSFSFSAFNRYHVFCFFPIVFYLGKVGKMKKHQKETREKLRKRNQSRNSKGKNHKRKKNVQTDVSRQSDSK